MECSATTACIRGAWYSNCHPSPQPPLRQKISCFRTENLQKGALLMPAGCHPNVSVPGHSIGFLWAMAARREVEDRQCGVVNIQPGFDRGSSGLEAECKK